MNKPSFVKGSTDHTFPLHHLGRERASEAAASAAHSEYRHHRFLGKVMMPRWRFILHLYFPTKASLMEIWLDRRDQPLMQTACLKTSNKEISLTRLTQKHYSPSLYHIFSPQSFNPVLKSDLFIVFNHIRLSSSFFLITYAKLNPLWEHIHVSCLLVRVFVFSCKITWQSATVAATPCMWQRSIRPVSRLSCRVKNDRSSDCTTCERLP